LSTTIKLKARRIFAGVDIDNVFVKLKLNESQADLYTYAVFDKKSEVKLDGILDLTGSTVAATLDTLILAYNNYNLVNKDEIKFSYSNNNLEIDNFSLMHGNGLVELYGNFSTEGQQNLSFRISDIDVEDISRYVFKLPPERRMDAVFNLD